MWGSFVRPKVAGKVRPGRENSLKNSGKEQPWRVRAHNVARVMPKKKVKRCSHGKLIWACSECTTTPLGAQRTGCPHGKRKNSCAKCSPCPHGKLKHGCKECSSCSHGRMKYSCSVCKAARLVIKLTPKGPSTVKQAKRPRSSRGTRTTSAKSKECKADKAAPTISPPAAEPVSSPPGLDLLPAFEQEAYDALLCREQFTIADFGFLDCLGGYKG